MLKPGHRLTPYPCPREAGLLAITEVINTANRRRGLFLKLENADLAEWYSFCNVQLNNCPELQRCLQICLKNNYKTKKKA